ncbi:MAG: heavy-metal-associated domain-containing protein [Chloroflexi bacterium]|nr:heavy-metal-associated domain-containing protein [Chloroflexota bacterium]
MARTEIPVKGMHCTGCERTLELALTRLDGVRSARPDRGSERVTVHYDPHQVSEERLREQIELCGYEVLA